jgi:hypothetical protein
MNMDNPLDFLLVILLISFLFLILYYIVKFAVKNALKELSGSNSTGQSQEPLDLKKLQVDEKTLTILKNYGLLTEEEYNSRLRALSLNVSK